MLADGAIAGWRSIEEHLSERQRRLCAFAEKLTRTPQAMSSAELESLREVGLDDGEILEVVHVIGYFNHINRVADALGVDPEEFMSGQSAP
ncbi:MAG: hypothetical protein AAF581_15570 [Planctomycetota bacterium]